LLFTSRASRRVRPVGPRPALCQRSVVIELHGAAKAPHAIRDVLVCTLGRRPASVHLCEGHVRGGFDIRGELYPEDVLAALAAMRFGRRVKWIEDRRDYHGADHSREQRH
jgi:CO/xanthine dehydrogenase Mo-binding subunit